MTTLAADDGPRLLRGGPIGTAIREQVAADVAAFRDEFGYAPALAVVVVGKDAPSAVYLHKILDGCRLVGIEDRLVELPAGRRRGATSGPRCASSRPTRTSPGSSSRCRCRKGSRSGPSSTSWTRCATSTASTRSTPGLLSLGYDGFLPATAHASIEILKQSGIEISGKHAVVVGRSNVDRQARGAPAPARERHGHGLPQQDREPRRRHPHAPTSSSSPSGAPTSSPATCSSRGAVVVDVGINVVDGKLTGDVDFASASASPRRSRRSRAASGRSPTRSCSPTSCRPPGPRPRGLVPLGAHSLAVAMPEAQL